MGYALSWDVCKAMDEVHLIEVRPPAGRSSCGSGPLGPTRALELSLRFFNHE